jgi:hypothetical protein
MEGRVVRHHFERKLLNYHSCQAWFNVVQWFQKRRFMSSSTYIPGFSVKKILPFQPIYSDYAYFGILYQATKINIV